MKEGESYQIMFCKLSSRDIINAPCSARVFLPNSTFFGVITAILVDEGKIYFAQAGGRATIEYVNKNGSDHTVFREYTSGVTSMKMYKRDRLPGGEEWSLDL